MIIRLLMETANRVKEKIACFATNTYSWTGSHQSSRDRCWVNGCKVPIWSNAHINIGLNSSRSVENIPAPAKSDVYQLLHENTWAQRFWSSDVAGSNDRPRWGMEFYIPLHRTSSYIVVEAMEVSSAHDFPSELSEFTLTWLLPRANKRIKLEGPYSCDGGDKRDFQIFLSESARLKQAIEVWISGKGDVISLAKKADYTPGCRGIRESLFREWGKRIFWPYEHERLSGNCATNGQLYEFFEKYKDQT